MDLSTFSGQSPAHNEFRSDTFTTPTLSMVQSLTTATLGDAVYNEDQATLDLEEKVAKLAGKEKGLFCVSGTLSNQIALRVNLFQPPYAILCDARSHVLVNEAGGMATLSQAMLHAVMPKNEVYMTLEDDIKPNFVPDDGEIHAAPTKVISLENTLHGMVYPLEEIKKISAFCKENDVRLHLDGARLWNASVASGVSIAEYCSYFDSVSLCLSKTIGAPIGSVLVADKKFINKANHFRKQNGGGIRQSGLIARMALTAIDENFSKLEKTHVMAKEIEALCKSLGYVLAHPVHTNFVFLDLDKSKINHEAMIELAAKYDIKLYGSRIAFHYQLSDESIDKLKKVLEETSHAGAGEKIGRMRLYSATQKDQ